jgi:alkylhydroperoxidase family enzyme
VTLLAGRPVAEALFQSVRAELDERELVLLTHAVALINAWNRLSAPFQTPPLQR